MAKSVTRWWALLVAMILGTVSKGGLAQNSFDAEFEAFQKARSENTETAYRDFLRRYPESQFTAHAFRDLVGTVVKAERPIFEPAFDNQLMIEGLMPAPLEPTLTAVPSNPPQDPSGSVNPSVLLPSPTAAATGTGGAVERPRGSVANRLLNPY